MISPLVTMLLMTTNLQTAAVPPLPPCPARPNCVSSRAVDSHRITPFKVTGDAGHVFEKLRTILAERPDTKVLSADSATIRVEFRTLLGFIDDGLFVLDIANSLIHVRSAARLGYWDMGKNRSRMEEIRKALGVDSKGV